MSLSVYVTAHSCITFFIFYHRADTNLDPIVNARQQMLKRARLEQDLDIKIKNRPGPLELIEGNILKPETEVEQYVKGQSHFKERNDNRDMFDSSCQHRSPSV